MTLQDTSISCDSDFEYVLLLTHCGLVTPSGDIDLGWH